MDTFYFGFNDFLSLETHETARAYNENRTAQDPSQPQYALVTFIYRVRIVVYMFLYTYMYLYIDLSNVIDRI